MTHELLAYVLRPLDPPLTLEHTAAWWADHRRATEALERPIDRAIVGATRVDRLGFAFAGGYAAALRAMVPSLPGDTLASLAATESTRVLAPEGPDGSAQRGRKVPPGRADLAKSTESTGAHPRAIATTLTPAGAGAWVLEGKKAWVTLGPEGGTILVVARVEPSSGDRPSLRVARVDAGAPGVTITPLAHMPFVPEISHGSVTLEGVRLADSQLLPGDGYDRYLKPFRTIEDVHVHAALLAWLLAVGARASWPHPIRERGCAILLATRALSEADPSAPATHVALGGAIAATRALIEECEPLWASVDEPTRTRWQRDRPLLDVASKARAARLESAWANLDTSARSKGPVRESA